MKTKFYVVSEEELKDFAIKIGDEALIEDGGIANYIADFLESKNPVEMIAEGKINYGFNGYCIGTKLVTDLMDTHMSKNFDTNITIYIGEAK